MAIDSSQEPIDTNELLENLTGRFSLEALRTLAFRVGVDWDELEGTGKTPKARELIAYLDRQGRLEELVAAADRPDATKPSMPAEAQPGGAQNVQQSALGDYSAQASHGGSATVNVYQQASPRPVNPEEVAAAEERLAAMPVDSVPGVAAPPEGTAWVTPDSRILTPKSRLVLEELTFEAQARPETAVLGRWFAGTVLPQTEVFGYWADKVQRDVVVLPEADFRFLVTTRTEIIQRIRLDRETGTAVAGALWSEEFLPADTVLYAPVGAQAPAQPGKQLQSAEEVLVWFKDLAGEHVQIGGGRTLGRGLVRLHWAKGSNA